jgi:hypothetical protein
MALYAHHGFGFDHDDYLLTPAARDRARRSGSDYAPIGSTSQSDLSDAVAKPACAGAFGPHPAL